MSSADRTFEERRTIARENLHAAFHDATCDIAWGPRAAEAFVQAFPAQRSHSRLYPAWLLLFALDMLSPAGLARNQCPLPPLAYAIRLHLTFPAWSEEADKHA